MGNQQGQPPQWPQQPGQQQPYPQQPYYQPQTPYPPGPKRRQRRLWLILAIVGGSIMFLCIACTTATTSAPVATQQATMNVTFTAPTTIAPTATATPRPMPTPSPTLVPTPKPTPTTVAQVQPTPKPTPKPQPTPTPTHATGIYGNPWGYNFDSTGGHLITKPPSNFCDYFPCITTFQSADDPDGGYVVQCVDGKFSQSGGESGSCSHHGGEGQPLYSH